MSAHLILVIWFTQTSYSSNDIVIYEYKIRSEFAFPTANKK